MDRPMRPDRHELDRYERVDGFLAEAGDWLVAREAEHNLMLGISSNLRDHPEIFDAPPYLAVVRHDGQIVAAAMRTPPWALILSEVDDEAAIDSLVTDLSSFPVPGVVGPTAAVRRFADRWVSAHGGRAEVAMEERIFRLERVIPPVPVSGGMREAGAADRGLLVDWIAAFGREALGDEDASRVAASVDDWLAGKGRRIWLWDDDGPVSLTGAGGHTPNGIRIGPVYTPPERRERGYASALVAAVSQAHLDAGQKFCFLYTDLANPTSNRIYQAIGYEPVTDALRIDFRP